MSNSQFMIFYVVVPFVVGWAVAFPKVTGFQPTFMALLLWCFFLIIGGILGWIMK